MHNLNLLAGRRARVLSAAAGALIQPLESRRLLTTIYVDMTATGSANGSDWSDAFPTLQAALAAAVSGDQIHVAQNIPNEPYTPGTNRADTFQLDSGVTIQGGYEGLAANSMFESPDNRDVNAYPTILSGDIGTTGDNSDNSYHVVTASGVDSDATLDGFTITAGNADGSGDENSADGAGILNIDGSPAVSNCTFTNNMASDSGGAVYDDISFSTFTSFNQCTFTQNSAVNNGGAIEDQEGSPFIGSCTFTQNSAGGNGGALDIENGLFVSSCVFIRNSAGGAGGAVKFAAFAEIFQSLFTGNSAAQGSAVQNDPGADTTFISCGFVGNSSSGTGGTIYDDQFSTVSLVNCTLTANVATANTAGVYNFNSSPTITNSILWNNTVGGSTVAEIYDADTNSSPTTTYTDVDGYAGPNSSNNFDTDPQFQRNPSAGMDGVWGTDDDDYGNIELQFTSPLIDVGNTSATQATNDSEDLGNHNRIVSNIVDLGAYESQIVYVDLNAHGNSTGADWADAFNDLGTGIGSAPAGALVKVAKGTYTGPFPLQPPFGSQGLGIILQGGYMGGLTSGANSRDLTHNVTTLSGGGTATHVVDVSNTDSTTVLDGFTITGGNANGAQDNYNDVGGGIYDLGGSPTIKNCIITNNSAQYYGGMYNSSNTGVNPPLPCAPTLIDCTFSNNTNGAMGDNGDSPTLIGCAFTNNVLGASEAGAINCSSEQMTLTDCAFTGNSNSNDGSGGAINCSGGELFMTGCSFISNTAADGGAINFRGNEMTAVNCLFANNTATGFTISGQTFGGSGGAIGIDDFPFEVAITNCTFSGNAAQLSGSSGGAIYEISANPVITNCIFWNDSAATANSSEIYDDPGRTDGSTVNHSDVEGGFAGMGTNNINADPKFVNPTAGNYQLMSGSPAIDKGDDNVVTTSTDLAGNQRVVGAHVDMGAYEVQIVPFAVVSTSFDINTQYLNFSLSGDVQTSFYDFSKLSLNRVNADGSLTPASISYSTGYSTRVFNIHIPVNTPDGNYRVSLGAGALKDTSGNLILASTPFDFFIFAADANHDRTVNALDFNALATNYGQPGDFMHGNFDYSGVVGSNDFDLLAARFGSSLAIPTGFTGMAMPAAVGIGTNHTTASLFSDSTVAASDWLNSSEDSLETL